MDLYHKKININNKVGRRLREKYREAELAEQSRNESTYLQKMLEKKHEARQGNKALNISSENIKNVRSNVEDILADEYNKKRAIKYVIEIGKNKRIQNNSHSVDYGKSESPKFGGKILIQPIGESYKNSPNKIISIHRREPQSDANKYISINDSTNNNQNFNNPTQEEIPNEFEMSSLEEDKGVYRSQEPGIMSRVNRVLKERYEKAAIKKPQERRNRNMIIPAMQKIRKHSNPNNFANYNFNNRNNNEEDYDDIDELLRTIEDLKMANNSLKNDCYNKSNEINILKKELDNMQKELDDKKIEHDKEIDELLKADENNPKLKNDFNKLMKEYDNNLNELNELKDNFNQLVDEYNMIKYENIRLQDDNRFLKNDIQKYKIDYNNMKIEANKAVDDYNNIIDDFNRLEQEHKELKNEYDKIKDRESMPYNENENIPSEIRDDEFNKLNEDYNKLNEEYNKLK